MKFWLKSAVLMLLVVWGIDGLIGYALAHPDAVARAPRFLSGLARRIYLDCGRSIIQYESACAQYDGGLAYTLKPGECVFSNAEFNTEYQINSRGVRGDEEGLAGPEIIVAGDSRAMGWGVAGQETYAALLQRDTGIKTLNASVSSYGTVREMMLLDRLDLSRLKVLVVHYVENDYEENAYFFNNGNKLRIMDESKYLSVQKKYEESKHYYFGKYTLFLLYRLGADIYNGITEKLGIQNQKSDVDYFLNALIHGRKAPLDGVRIIVLANGPFLEKLAHALASGDFPPYIEKIVLAEEDLPESGYFKLDNHMNATGHRLLADRLLSLIR